LGSTAALLADDGAGADVAEAVAGRSVSVGLAGGTTTVTVAGESAVGLLGDPALLLTGTSGILAPASDEAAALERTVAPPLGSGLAVTLAAAAEDVDMEDVDMEGTEDGCAWITPTTLPQAASSSAVMPCPAAISAVRRLR